VRKLLPLLLLLLTPLAVWLLVLLLARFLPFPLQLLLLPMLLHMLNTLLVILLLSCPTLLNTVPLRLLLLMCIVSLRTHCCARISWCFMPSCRLRSLLLC
jgi:hypothetical protein